MIVSEHAFRPIKGKILLTGRQSVVPSEQEVRDYLLEFGVEPKTIDVELDNDTREAKDGWITDSSFFSMFTDAEIHSVDVTDYENASIIHDMNFPIPDEYKGKFDFIYNGSVMDNIFNPTQFLINCSDLLAPGGRVIHAESAALIGRSYNTFTADWFNDYYAINKFRDCKVYYARLKWRVLGERWKIFQLRSFQDDAMTVHKHTKMASIWPHLVLCLAEKDENSTSEMIPIQHQYRPKDENWDTYFESFRRFESTKRHPLGYGKPTRPSRDYKQKFRKFLHRPMVISRTNCKYLQKL